MVKIFHHFTGRERVIEFIILSRTEGVKGNTKIFASTEKVKFIINNLQGRKG